MIFTSADQTSLAVKIIVWRDLALVQPIHGEAWGVAKGHISSDRVPRAVAPLHRPDVAVRPYDHVEASTGSPEGLHRTLTCESNVPTRHERTQDEYVSDLRVEHWDGENPEEKELPPEDPRIQVFATHGSAPFCGWFLLAPSITSFHLLVKIDILWKKKYTKK